MAHGFKASFISQPSLGNSSDKAKQYKSNSTQRLMDCYTFRG